MRKRKYIQFLFYLVFCVMVAAAIIVSGKLSREVETVERAEGLSILLEDKEISALYCDGRQVWVGCNDGMIIYDSQTLEVVRTIDDLEIIYTSAITETPDHIVWVGHEEGLTGFGADGGRFDFAWPELPKGRINAVEWDGEYLWCGSYNGAASLEYSESGWMVTGQYGKEDGLISDSVNVIRCIDGDIWFASYLDHKSGGITIVSGDKITCLSTESGLPHPYITSLQAMGNGQVLAGCGYMENGGLAVLEKGAEGYEVREVYGYSDGIPGEKVRYLYCDSRGYLWITTEYDGVLVVDYDSDGLTRPLQGICFTEANGLSDNEIKCIAETEQYYWLGGKYGLTLIEKASVENRMKTERQTFSGEDKD